jgi:hypothetical protein
VVRHGKGLWKESLQDEACFARNLPALRGRCLKKQEENIQPVRKISITYFHPLKGNVLLLFIFS